MIIYHEANLQLFYRQLENELEQLTAELDSTRDALRHKEEEAEECKSRQNDMVEQVSLANQKVEDSQAAIRQQEAELARLREVLRRTEKELDERVAHLEQRYLFSEEERSMYTKILLEFFFAKKKYIKGNVMHVWFWISGKTQEQGLRRVEELKTELLVLKEANRDEKKKQILLEEKLPALTEELTKQKVTQTFWFCTLSPILFRLSAESPKATPHCLLSHRHLRTPCMFFWSKRERSPRSELGSLRRRWRRCWENLPFWRIRSRSSRGCRRKTTSWRHS